MSDASRYRGALERIRDLAASRGDFDTCEIVNEVLSGSGKPRPELTDRQAEVLAYIRETIQGIGYPPTSAEIATHFGCHRHAIQGHLEALSLKGCLTWAPKRARSIVLTEAS